MTQPGRFVADPEQMKAAATAVTATADHLNAGFQTQRDGLAPAAGQSAGWDTSTAARSAAESWAAYTDGVRRNLAAVAEAITAAAAGYRHGGGAAAGSQAAGRGNG